MKRIFLFALALIGVTTTARAQAPHLWTVQAMNAGNGTFACDAFAAGAAGRPPYEFRFRRWGTRADLIISYSGKKILPFPEALVLLDGKPFVSLPVAHTAFGDKPAVDISIDPANLDFYDLERHQQIAVVVGDERFTMQFNPADRIAKGMDWCKEYIAKRK